MSNLSAAPALEVTCLNTASAVGLLQMLPRQTNNTLVLPASPAIIKGDSGFAAGSGSRDRCPAFAAAVAALEVNAPSPRVEAERWEDDADGVHEDCSP